MRYALFVQGFDQLEEKYSKVIANTIKGNCQTWAYLQSDDPETLREISEKLGSYTTSSYQLSASHGKYTTPSTSHSVSLTERKLLTTDEVRRVKRPYQIVTSRNHPALMYAPDLSQWHFNKMLGLGDMEHNRRLREEREKKRPVITDTRQEIALWNIWIYYQKDIMRRLAQQKSAMGRRPRRYGRIRTRRFFMEKKWNMGRLKGLAKTAGAAAATLAVSFCSALPAHAAGVNDSQIVKGTERLIGDVTTWLMVLAPRCGGASHHLFLYPPFRGG